MVDISNVFILIIVYQFYFLFTSLNNFIVSAIKRDFNMRG